MRNAPARLLLSMALAWASVFAPDTIAQQSPPPEQPQAAAETTSPEIEKPADDAGVRAQTKEKDSHTGDVIFNVGGKAELQAGDTADAVIALLGSAISAGDVRDGVASVFGETRVTGKADFAVALFGNTYVNSEITDTAMAIFGDLELGPQAIIHNEAAAIGGTVRRAPGAVTHGGVQEVSFGRGLRDIGWLRAWIEHCLLFGRPLAFEAELAWAWWIAFGFLGFYALIALLFNEAVEKCVQTLETQPGPSVVASLLTVLLTPVLVVLLVMSLIGIGLVPFLGIGLFGVGLFGKAVILGALGRRITRLTGIAPLGHIAFAVIVGGLLVLGLYVVPFFGFIAYKVVGILGTGVVVYTVILAARKRSNSPAPQPSMPPSAARFSAESPQSAAAQDPAEASQSDAESARNSVPPRTESAPEDRAAEIAAPTLPRAGFWIRMGALLIDFVLIGIVISILDPPGEVFLLSLAIYGAVMWKLRGTTIGGIILNLRIVRLDGREITWDTAIVRALSCFLSFACAGLGFLWIAFDPDRQAWHDKIAGTVVVRAQRAAMLV
jgi:uncharacterized RDD family membrane protein YckC